MPDTGQKDQALITGRIGYGYDGTNAYPVKSGTDGRVVIAQREPFEFRPGQQALVGISGTITTGAVLSGTRTGSGTITTAGTASSTYWGTDIVYSPLRTGKIDGKTTGGIIEGQLTIGLKTSAATADAKVTARIASGTTTTGTATTFLGLSGTAIACSTAEVFSTYDINYLQTDSVFNSVPFAMAIGVQSSLAGTTITARVMESSAIRGEFEPLT